MGRGLCLELSRRDRHRLDELLSGGLQPVRTVLRALALRQMADGQSTPAVGVSLGLSAKAVWQIAKRYQQGGLDRALFDGARPGKAPALDQEQRQRIIAVACSPPPKTSWMRLRSRIRGSVAPPTHRLTVLTETPSWRAAASCVSPSRRNALDIHSAKVPGWPGSPITAGAGGWAAGLAGAVRVTGGPGTVGDWMGLSECSTSTSTCSAKMRNATWMEPVGPAASSSARNTVSPTSRLPSSVSGDSARQRRTKSLMSGIDDGRAVNTWDTTTTGTTSI